jgi:hypothetical protein
MWAINTILSTRVYLNLVWHARETTLTTCHGHRMDQVSTSIHMRVPTTLVSFTSSMMDMPDFDQSALHSSNAPSTGDLDTYPMHTF